MRILVTLMLVGCTGAPAPKPPAEQLWKAAAEGASGFHLRQAVRVVEQDRLSLLERCCKSCAPGEQGQSNT